MENCRAHSNSFTGGFKDCSYAGPLSQWEQEQQRDSYPIRGRFRCATLKEANDNERERFENEKKIFENEKELHDIKIAETNLKNVSAILSNPPASKAQLKRMRAQEVFLTGVVMGVDFDNDLEQATSAQRRKVGE